MVEKIRRILVSYLYLFINVIFDYAFFFFSPEERNGSLKSYLSLDVPGYLNFAEALPVLLSLLQAKQLAPTEPLSQNVAVISRFVACKVYAFSVNSKRYGDAGERNNSRGRGK